VAARDAQRGQHARHDERLRHHPTTDGGDRAVRVREEPLLAVDEELARDAAHRADDAIVRDQAADPFEEEVACDDLRGGDEGQVSFQGASVPWADGGPAAKGVPVPHRRPRPTRCDAPACRSDTAAAERPALARETTRVLEGPSDARTSAAVTHGSTTAR